MKSFHSITFSKRKRLIKLIIFTTVIFGVAVGWYYFDKYSKRYIKPAFETSYTEGAVEVDEEYKYSELEVPKEYTVGSCATPHADKDGIDLYFSNPKKNDAYLRCEIFDENDKKIGESGVIKPNSYVKRVNFDGPMENGRHTLTVKVLGYEPDTYFSKGNAKMIINVEI